MYDFSLWVGIGATLGMWRIARSVPERQTNAWVNAALVVLSATLAGARLFYVLINHAYFAAHLIEIPQFWTGGLAWPGALAGAWLAILFLVFVSRSTSSRRARFGKSPLSLFGDRLYPLLPPIAITTWLACWKAGIAYGPLLPPGTWYGVPSLDESGSYHLRFPLQLLAALSLLIYFGVLELRVRPLQPPGKLSTLAWFGLLLNLLLASLLRADPAPYWNGIRLDTWMAIAFLAVFSMIVLLNFLINRLWKKHVFTSARAKETPT